MSQITHPDMEPGQLAHDLRNALSPILLYAQILEVSLAKLSLEKEEEMARLISESITEMDAMIVQKFSSHHH